MLEGKDGIEEVLMALSEQLGAEDAGLIEIVVCGGAALNILGYVQRTTEDIDVIAFVDKDEQGMNVLIKANPMKPALLEAARRAQRDFDLKENWLNAGPSPIMNLGLPDGLMDRVEARTYGENLIVHFLSRYDQIHFKLYAAIDQGGKHFDDLMALNPTADELEKAARWSMTHNPFDEYKRVLKRFLEYIGYEDVADKL